MTSRVGVNLRASAYLHQGDRKYMEDEFQVAYQRTLDKKDIEYAFFGIFDGHGGKEAAHFAKDNLMDNIVNQRAFWSDDDEEVLSAIKEGFIQTHLAMRKVVDQWPRTASGWPSTSGTTASVAFIRRQKIYIGHVGDSGIVLGYEDPGGEWRGEALTKDHKPESLVEKARIIDCGGKVINKSGVPRVVWNRPKWGHQGPVRRSTPMDEIPFLAVARSLGDLWSYNATNDQFVVSPVPDVCVIPINIAKHRCLIFGTDGLWNVKSPNSAVHVAYSAEKNNEKHYLGIPTTCGKQRLWLNPSRSIVSSALDSYALLRLRADNTSAVTVFLDPPGRPKREVLLQQKGMKKSPVKLKRSSEEDKNREATVKVHVYNQNQTPRQGASRGVLKIKERIPEEWQQQNADDPQNYTEPGSPETGCEDPQQNEGDDEGGGDGDQGGPDMDLDTKVECTECGCTNMRQAEPAVYENCDSEHDDSVVFTRKIRIDDPKPEPDDIQIPVVSSSTLSPSTESKPKKIVASVKKEQNQNQDSSENEDIKRRTRSGFQSGVNNSSENRDQNRLSTNNNNSWKDDSSKTAMQKVGATTSRQTRHSIGSLQSTRVLKLINRQSIPSSLALTPSKLPSKRGRGGQHEGAEGEPGHKSARVHTRSHTWSHKSMVTRSQKKRGCPRHLRK
ncbi:protein phosphatase 2C [Oratosquilla oratoria]|uniref:protein phosphatase 2C n=1 Tax=Oratosquilla oratoria TaxID=337810 RepID=UPI003F777D30